MVRDDSGKMVRSRVKRRARPLEAWARVLWEGGAQVQMDVLLTDTTNEADSVTWIFALAITAFRFVPATRASPTRVARPWRDRCVVSFCRRCERAAFPPWLSV